MRRSLMALPLVALAATAAACSNDNNGGPDAATDAPADTSAADVTADVTTDTGSDAGPSVHVLVQFDPSKGQLPEGLWEVSPNAQEFIGTTGTPITAWAPAAAPVTIGTSGAQPFGTLTTGTPTSTYTLGVITDATGNVYYAVAAAAAPPNDPAPGIYKLPSGGGAATLFSAGSAATPPMSFANGLDFIGANLFVADSEGVIYKVDTTGKATVWSQDALLAPSMSACGGKVPLPIGANGIVHDSSNVYVTNTDYGRLVKIPIQGDGSAGTASVVKEDCATLVGADGLLIDPKDQSFIIALNVLNEIVRVAPDGSSVSVLASGSPLANPASPILDTAGGQKRLLVTNPAFFTAPDAGAPNLVELLIP